MSGKVVVLNGKRFVVGNSKIKPTKCHIEKKKTLSREEIIKQKKKNKIKIMSMPNRRKTKRTSRKNRNDNKTKDKI